MNREVAEQLTDAAIKVCEVSFIARTSLADTTDPQANTELKDSLGINTEQQAYEATILWDSDRLLSIPSPDRENIAKTLITEVNKFNVKAPLLWQEVITKSDLFDDWREEMETDTRFSEESKGA